MRISTNIFLFFLLANLGIGFFASAGVWNDLGVDYNSGIGDHFQDARDEADKLLSNTQGNIGGTIVAFIASGFLFFISVGNAILFGVPDFLRAVGAPNNIVVVLKAVVIFILAFDLWAIKRGVA